jgi:hypothetical protein
MATAPENAPPRNYARVYGVPPGLARAAKGALNRSRYEADELTTTALIDRFEPATNASPPNHADATARLREESATKNQPRRGSSENTVTAACNCLAWSAIDDAAAAACSTSAAFC